MTLKNTGTSTTRTPLKRLKGGLLSSFTLHLLQIPPPPLPPSIQIMAARSKAISLLIFFGILFLCSPATTTSATSVESDAQVDYFYLTLKWLGTACKLGRCCMPTTGEPAMDFLVEDMKTYDSRTGKVVENCKTTCKFNVRPINDLISNLYSHWSDVGCPCNNGLQNWKHTWCTYGQCSNLTQHDYIQTALNIAARASLLDVFEANDIVPSASTTYKLEDIQRALQANLGSATYLECYNTGIIRRTSMLYKINICISKNGKSIIGCPFTKETTCRDNVMFYPFTGNMLQPCGRATSSASLIKMPTEQDLAV
ncbi:hypothetical protein J5N97_012501 [Dioscorea zingiberensis]|uniref:Uncharacterized protein n=1 Tax=Dioscorea zingiberensis TaxID=325984 RepID=A0A9D5HI57_9LILI|nr:hypothetical protein J5N97_012501 [Dioscorea zingiberensis]